MQRSPATSACRVVVNSEPHWNFAAAHARDAGGAWRSFIDRYTPIVLACIERAGIRDRDEAMEIYVRVCERLAQNDCERLRRFDPTCGTIHGWLSVLVRHVMVDWVRARAGRRRLFGAVKRLEAWQQRVFELYFWEDRTPAEIAETLTTELRRRVSLLDVLRALDAIDAILSDRHRRELLSSVCRSRPAVSLEAELEANRFDVADGRGTPEEGLSAREREALFAAALAELPEEDAAIVQLHYGHGLSLHAVRRALHLPELTAARLKQVVTKLQQAVSRRQMGRCGFGTTASAAGATACPGRPSAALA